MISMAYVNYIFSICLRGTVSLFQFGAFYVTGKFLGVQDIGHYSFYMALMGIGLIIGNLNLQTVATVDLVTKEKTIQDVAKELLLLVTLVWPVILVVLSVVFFVFMPVFDWALLFAGSLSLALLNNFCENLFVALKKPFKAAVVQLLRNSWFFAALLMAVLGSIDFELVLKAMLFFEFFCAMFCMAYFFRSFRFKSFNFGYYFKMFLRSVRSGLKFTAIGGLLVFSIYVQRFMIEADWGISKVAEFYLLYSIVMIPPVILESGIFGIFLPALIDKGSSSSRKSGFTFISIGFFMLLAYYLVLSYSLQMLYLLLDKLILLPSMFSYSLFCCFGLSYYLMRVAHYFLYAQERVYILLSGYALGFVFCVLVGLWFIPFLGVSGGGLSLLSFSISTLLFFGVFLCSSKYRVQSV